MYPGEMLWDLKAEGGPKQVHVAHAAEALARDPKRYSRTKPEVPTAEPAHEPHRGGRRHRGED